MAQFLYVLHKLLCCEMCKELQELYVRNDAFQFLVTVEPPEQVGVLHLQYILGEV